MCSVSCAFVGPAGTWVNAHRNFLAQPGYHSCGTWLHLWLRGGDFMGLAALQVTTNDFQTIYAHLMAKPVHRNMHIRQMRTQNGQQGLRYLHAMFATSPTEIEGALSGPVGLCQYRLLSVAGQTQLQVAVPFNSAPEDDRLERRFLPEIFSRIHQERTMGPNVRPRAAAWTVLPSSVVTGDAVDTPEVRARCRDSTARCAVRWPARGVEPEAPASMSRSPTAGSRTTA